MNYWDRWLWAVADAAAPAPEVLAAIIDLEYLEMFPDANCLINQTWRRDKWNHGSSGSIK